MKKILLITILMPILGNAQIQSNYHEYTAKDLKGSIIAPYAARPNGLPKPGQGIVVKPLKVLDPAGYARYESLKQSLASPVTEYSDSHDAEDLIHTVELGDVDFTKYDSNSDPEDTEIKKSLGQLNLVFEYKDLSRLSGVKTSGYAVNGIHTSKGWNGVSQFFKHANLGHCVYERTNYDVAKGAIYLPKERTSKAVNKKITMIYHYGNPKDGYSYTVSWYEDNFMNEIRCANKISSTKLASEIIKFAKTVDAYN